MQLIFSLFSFLVLLPFVVGLRRFVFINNCPTGSTLFINNGTEGTIQGRGGRITLLLPNDFSGYAYITANGGNAVGEGATKAAFFGPSNYYYIVVDPDNFNTGIRISPSRSAHSGFCRTQTCRTETCGNAFRYKPDMSALPPPSSSAPDPPLYACPPSSTNYTVTFCPSGNFPPPTRAVTIHPRGNRNKCMDVRGGRFANGTPVQVWDCNGTRAQKWIVKRGVVAQVRLAGSDFCLDTGSMFTTGTKMKIAPCQANLPAQSWFYTNSNVFELFYIRNKCLDLTNGSLRNGNRIQIANCATGSINQRFTTRMA